MSVSAKIIAGSALGLLMIVVLGVTSYVSTQHLIETNHMVAHTHEVLGDLEASLSLLKDAETGQRGFILTGDERYLEPYNTALGAIRKQLDAVDVLTRDNPAQQQSLERVRKLSDERLARLQKTIEVRRERGLQAALPEIATGEGRRMMDDLRSLVDVMEDRERQLLDIRNRAADATARRTIWTIDIGMLVALLALAVAAVSITRSVRFAGPAGPPRVVGGSRARTAGRYLLAAAVVTLAAVVRWRLEVLFGPLPHYITLYPAVLVVASLAGGGPGIAATLLAAVVATYAILPPFGQFRIEAPYDILALGIFTGSGLFLSVLAERLHRARWAEAIIAAQDDDLALLDMGTLLALDPDHRITHWSDGARRLYGFDAHEAEGRITHELFQTRLPEPLQQIRRGLLETGHWQGELLRRRKDGTELVVMALWALRRDRKGEPLAILEVASDITKQKHAEEELQAQSEELSQQNEELTQTSEELSRQSEELAQQNEELQRQSEEIQTLNVELTRREEMLQKLLDASRAASSEQAVLQDICVAASGMFGESAAVISVCEKQAGRLFVRAAAGLPEGGPAPEWRQVERSFAELVIQQNRTACLNDVSLRSDLSVLRVSGGDPFQAALCAPMQKDGQAFGVVGVYSRKKQEWTAEQFRLAEWLAVQCAHILETLRTQDRLRWQAAMIDLSPDGIMVRRLDGTITFWSQGAETLYGWTRQEAVGQTTHALLKTQLPQSLDEINRQLRQTGRWSGELVHQTKAGRLVVVQSWWLAQRDESGQVAEILESNVDITERKRAEESLRKLSRAVEQSPATVVITDAEGSIEYVNPQFTRATGYTFEEAKGKNPRVLKTDITPPETFEQLWKTLKAGGEWHGEFCNRKKNGELYWESASISPITDADGRTTHYVAVKIDITDRKHAEKALLDRLEEIERFNRLTTGRELRVVALKQEINDLLRVAGYPPRYNAVLDESAGTAELPPEPEVLPVVVRAAPEADGYSLADLLDVEQMQRLLDTFCDTAGIASAIIDADGQVFVGSRWHRICTDYHRANERTCAKCIESDTVLASQLNEGEQFSIYQCRNGLTDAASPIIIEGRHIANVFVGQFLLEPADEAFFRRQAADYGFDEAAYLDALRSVPVVPREKLPPILEFLTTCAKLVAAMGLERIRAKAGELELSHRAEELDGANLELRRQREAAVSLAEDANEARTSAERAEQALREARDYLENLFNYANAPIIVWDSAFRITRFNRAFERLTGRTADAVIGQPLDILFPEAQQEEALEHVWHASAGERLEVVEIPIQHVDGTVRTVLWNSATLYGSDGTTVVATIAQGQDITDRKDAEEGLRTSNARLELLAETAGTLLKSDSPLQVVDGLCRKVLEHLDCQVFFNYLVDAAAGRLHLNACAGVSDEVVKRIEWLDFGSAVCGCVARDGCRIVAEDIPNTPGPRTDLVRSFGVKAYACHPLLSRGRVIGTLSFGTQSRTSFTADELAMMKAVADHVAIAMERKEAVEALRQTADDLARSNRDLEQFAYVASHDLQEPLRTVAGYLQLIQRRYQSKLDPEADEFIEFAVEGAQRLKQLINDLLSYSRVGTKGRPFEPTDTNRVLKGVLEGLGGVIRENHATVTYDRLPTVPADGAQLSQLFQNLISNAIKFRGDEPPRIHVAAEQVGGQWQFSVRDNGIGLEPQYFDRIFIVFQRLHTRTRYPGTGIGLAICKRIVDRHGGRIWLESEPGRGSTFYFTLSGGAA